MERGQIPNKIVLNLIVSSTVHAWLIWVYEFNDFLDRLLPYIISDDAPKVLSSSNHTPLALHINE